MSKNTLKTFVLLAGLGGLAVAIGGLLGGGPGATIGFLIGLVFVGASYWFSDKLALKAAHAQVVTEAEAPELYGLVRSLTQRAGMPMPRVAVSPNEQPNAFATGRNDRHAVVCATRGLLEFLPREELEGVMAHELMHVKHRDILIGSVAAAIATGISYVAQMAMFSAMFGGRDDDEGSNPIAVLAVALLAPISAQLIQMAVSRSREFEADRGAARLLGNGESLARALERIEAYANRMPAMQVNPAQAAAWIHNPLADRPANPRRQANAQKMARLFTTHPPTEERIQRLRSREWASN